MKKMVLGFTIFLIVMLCFMSTALAEGDLSEDLEQPTQTEELTQAEQPAQTELPAQGEPTPMSSPTPSPTPALDVNTQPAAPVATPEPTPVVDQLIIDSWRLYDGMDRTYQQGYVPRVVDGRVYIILPLLGETYDGKVTVTADLGATAGSPFVFGNYSQTAGGWGAYVFVFEIPLNKDRINGSYPITFYTDYLNVQGVLTEQTFTVHVTITDGDDPPDPNAPPPKEAVEKPELFISDCVVTPDTVGGEETFTVEVTIDNIGAIRARSVRLSYGSETAGIIPADTNSAMHLENIASEDSATVSFQLKTTKDVIAGDQPFYVTLDYVDLYGGVYTSTRTFLVRITQPAEISYDPISVPKQVTAGETLSLPANVFNIGKSTLRNVTITVTGAGLFPTSSVFLGDVQPGKTGNGEMKVFIGMLSMTEGYSEDYGPTNGVYTITYTDDGGEEYKIDMQFSTEILKPVIEGEETEEEKLAKEQEQKTVGQWWITIVVGFAVIAIIVAVIVVGRFSRMMRLK